VTFGRKVPKGHLPVFSVGTEGEAKDLIVLACGTNQWGQYIARELVMDQTLENLQAFSDRLAEAHEVLVKHGKCTCKKELR
jgi:hypothetical protein